jgi:hypothetical protein
LIGARALFQDLIPLFVILLTGLALAPVFFSRQRWWKNVVFWAVFTLWLFLASFYCARMVAQLDSRRFLTTLNPQNVQSITLGGVILTQASAKGALIGSLRQLRWFASSHGGWATEVPLRFQLTNGEHKDFVVAFYPRQRGAVIRAKFRSWLHTPYDCGFSSDLPDILASLGTPLPTER